MNKYVKVSHWEIERKRGRYIVVSTVQTSLLYIMGTFTSVDSSVLLQHKKYLYTAYNRSSVHFE